MSVMKDARRKIVDLAINKYAAILEARKSYDLLCPELPRLSGRQKSKRTSTLDTMSTSWP